MSSQMRKIRTGLYETTIAGHVVQVERIKDGPTWCWTYYVDGCEPAEPWATRADALWSAEQGINGGIYEPNREASKRFFEMFFGIEA